MSRLVFIVLAVAVLACGGAVENDDPSRMQLAASIPPHAWLAEQIGGGAVEVTTVLGPGDSPATYQPSDEQVSRLLASRTFFRAGVPFENGPWFEALEEKMRVVDLRDGVEMRPMEDHGSRSEPARSGHIHRAGDLDPHTWLSPTRVAVQARRIADTLHELDPSRAATYSAGVESLVARLERLDGRIRSALAPHRGRPFIVFHPSWGYYADDFGLRQIAIETGGKEPSDIELSAVQRLIREHRISTIFVQPQIAGQSAAAVAEAFDLRVDVIDQLAPNIVANLELVTARIEESLGD